jgi:cytochrome P450
MTLAFDPFRSDWRHDPYPAYRELRDSDGLHFAPESGVWCVARYADAQHVLRNAELFSSRAMFTVLMNNGQEGPPPINAHTLGFIARIFLRTGLNPFTFASARNLIAEDGESHAAMRHIVNRGFSPKRIAAWEPRARQIVADCLARAQASDSFDVVRDLAIPLPVTLIAELLGIESGRLADFKRWSDGFIYNVTGPGREDPFNRAYQEILIELVNYVKAIARARQRAPADDLVSAIVAQQDGGVGLSVREVVTFVILLMVAGNETTTNLIGNATNALLDHPEALARVAADPARVPDAIEETVRYDGPIQVVFRKATRDAVVAGTAVPEGGVLAVLLGSANRDERRFSDPDRFDLDRDRSGHLGFGWGKHFCLGASLARLEGRVALEALVPLLPELERADADPPRLDSFLVRGPLELPLRRAA